MIPFDAFLVFVAAAMLPVTYILIVRHFIESDPNANSSGH